MPLLQQSVGHVPPQSMPTSPMSFTPLKHETSSHSSKSLLSRFCWIYDMEASLHVLVFPFRHGHISDMPSSAQFPES